VNSGDDRELSDIWIALWVSIKLMSFFVKTLGFLGEIDKTPSLAKVMLSTSI